MPNKGKGKRSERQTKQTKRRGKILRNVKIILLKIFPYKYLRFEVLFQVNFRTFWLILPSLEVRKSASFIFVDRHVCCLRVLR